MLIDEGGRVVDAVLVAQLVERLLVDEGIQQAGVDVWGDHIGGQGITAAARSEERRVGKECGS